MGPKCNSINLEQTPPSYSRAKHQCNSCQSHKDLTTGESLNTCQKNNSCWGNLCFVHLKAEQFVQFYDDEYDEPGPPVKEDSQNLQFGCVLTDQPQSVQIGCNIEWTSGEISVDGDNKISLIECICDSKFCNHKDLLSIKFDRTPLLTTTPAAISVASDAQLTTAKTNLIVPVKTSGAFPHRTPFVSLIFWVVFILLVKRQE